MGQAGKTAVGVLMVTVFAGLLMAWITLRQQMVDVESFYHLSVTPDGSVLAPLDDHLLHIPATGEQRVLSLTDMGLSGHFGRFAPLDNDTFMALMVRDKPTTDLKRCSLSGQYCETIASADFHPASAHRLYWLPAPERLLAVDNAGHRIVLLARDGRRVDQLDGFRYPNGVHVDGERIAVADTNQHRVVEIAVTRDGFGRELAEHEVWKSLEYRWPAEVHRDPWGWVIQVAGDAMDKDIVAPYSARWSEEGEVDPAAGRDVISSAFSDRKSVV